MEDKTQNTNQTVNVNRVTLGRVTIDFDKRTISVRDEGALLHLDGAEIKGACQVG